MTSAKAWSRVMTWPRSPIRDLQIFDQSGQEDTKSEASSWCAPSPFFSAASAPQSVSICLEVGRRLVECVAPQRTVGGLVLPGCHVDVAFYVSVCL